MAEEINETETVDEVDQENVDTQEATDQQSQDEEMIPKSQMEKIIQDRVARANRQAEKQVEEAKRLAKMNEDEKEKYRLDQLEKELEEYKRKDAYYGLSKEASKMLAEYNIQADDDLLQFVVKDDAEGTQAAVNAFVSLVNAKVEEGVKKTLAGSTPRANLSGTSALTKEKIMQEKDSTKRVKLIQENPHLFK